MPILQESKGKYSIFLPKAIVEAKGWKKGIELKVEFNQKGDLVLKEKS